MSDCSDRNVSLKPLVVSRYALGGLTGLDRSLGGRK